MVAFYGSMLLSRLLKLVEGVGPRCDHPVKREHRDRHARSDHEHNLERAMVRDLRYVCFCALRGLWICTVRVDCYALPDQRLDATQSVDQTE